MSLGFLPCRDAGHAERIREALEECVGLLTRRLAGDGLVAVVLTGSFARGEGTVLPLGGGVMKVLGDFEFFVVFATLAQANRRQRQLAAWGREMGLQLAGRGIRVEVEFGPVDAAFLRSRARPSIFVHDLREHGKVLWGDASVLQQIPVFNAAEIPREDAVRLVFNRIIEQLAAWERVPHVTGTDLLDMAYQRLKLTLDLAGSALAFAGRHTALYRRRPAEFARLVAETPSLATLLPRHFAHDLAEAARAKIEPTAGFPAPPATAGVDAQRAWLRAGVAGAVPAVAGVLTWELQQLLDVRAGLDELLSRCMHQPSLLRRVKDWAKFVLNPMPAPRPISHLRAARLFWTSTPRGLIHAAGARAYLALGDGRTPAESASPLLPLSRAARPRNAATERQAIVALWQWCVRNV